MDLFYEKKGDEMQVPMPEVGKIYAVYTDDGWLRVRALQVSGSEVRD